MTMLQTPVLLLTISSLFFPIASAIKCHQCGGAENIPKFAKNAMNKLNISTGSLYGDCKSTSGSDTCSDGTFCIKRAKVYQIGYSGVNLKWTTYTKGCATLREDNDGIPTNTCYDLGQVGNTTGYTAKRVDCYCQKDFCNVSPSSTVLVTFIVTIISMIYLSM